MPERLDVIVGNKIIQRGDIALGDGLGDHLRRPGFGFGGTFARFGVAERGFLAALGLQDLALFGAFGTQDFRLPLAFGLQNIGALDALGLHLASHRFHEVGRRHDVLDLDAVDLQSPRRHGSIHHAQQSLVDLVAMRQHLVEVHRAHHRTNIGHGQHDDRLVEIGYLVARFRRIEHLEERDAVHRHGGVVLGDHLLLGNADHLLHHVHLAADAIEIGNDDVEPRRQRAGVFAEPLDGPVEALRHRLDAGEQRKNNQQHKRDGEDVKTSHKSSKAGHEMPPGAVLFVCTPPMRVQPAVLKYR